MPWMTIQLHAPILLRLAMPLSWVRPLLMVKLIGRLPLVPRCAACLLQHLPRRANDGDVGKRKGLPRPLVLVPGTQVALSCLLRAPRTLFFLHLCPLRQHRSTSFPVVERDATQNLLRQRCEPIEIELTILW